MIFWVKTACLFLIRSRRTSIVLTLMVLSAVSCLIFLSSLAMGVNDSMIRNSVGLFSGHIAGFNIPSTIKKEEFSGNSIVNVLKRRYVKGSIHFKDRVEMISMIGIQPLQEQKTSAFWKKATKGRFLKENTNEIFISESIAKGMGLVCGDTLGFSPGPLSDSDYQPKDFIVTGIYKTGIDQLDRGIAFCDIRAIKSDTPWNAAVFIEDGAKMDRVLQQFNKKNLNHLNFKTWKQLMPDLEQLIALNYFSMSIVIVIVFIIVSLGITSAFSIFILKSIREYGIMKVMGMTTKETVVLLLWEVFLINIIASFLGMILGVIIVLIFQNIGIDLSGYTSHNQYFLVSGVIYPRLTVYSLFLPPLSALFFSFPAAVWPALMVTRKNAVDILRGN